MPALYVRQDARRYKGRLDRWLERLLESRTIPRNSEAFASITKLHLDKNLPMRKTPGRGWRAIATAGLIIAATAGAAPPEVVRMIADITTSPRGASFGSLTVINNELYFVANDGAHGPELWKSDGTNVSRLTDICYGTTPSFIAAPTLFNNEIYFRGASLSNDLVDVELWKLSGTNVSQAATIRPGPSGSNPAGFMVYNGILYFAANDGTTGTELWAYDGFSAYPVVDLNAGPGSSNPSGLTVYNGLLCFAASNNIFGSELFTFDGFSLTPREVNFGAANSNPSGFTAFNGVLYFQATNVVTGAELWAFDGLNVYLAGDLRIGGSSSPANFKVFQGSLYFAANDGVNGNELWRYDGVNPTVRVTQIAAGSSSSNPANLQEYNNHLYFAATDNTFGVELWRFDGATETRITDLNPNSASSSPNNLTVYKGHLYCSIMDATATRILARYDGTTVAPFGNIKPGTDGSFPDTVAVFNGALYFRADSSNGPPSFFYKYDGANVTTISTTIYPQSPAVEYKGALHFRYNTSLYRYNGTNFTAAVAMPQGSIDEMMVFGGDIYFTGEQFDGREIYRYNGTNITRITDIYPGSADSNPAFLTPYQGKLYFMATDATGAGLWSYDRTNVARVGTMRLLQFNSSLLIYNGDLYLTAATNGVDFQPWKWNGTNFSLAAQINPYQTNSSAFLWATNHGAAYLMGDDGTHGYELWKYDGTNATRLTDFSGLSGYLAFAHGNCVYFMADDQVTGPELYRYDGVTVSQVADLNRGYSGSLPWRVREFSGAYYFTADDGVHGNELWRLDPVSQLVSIKTITKQGNNIALTWTSPGGMTNFLQSADGPMANFTDRSPALIAPAGNVTTVNHLDVGGGTNATRYYRVRLP